MTIESLDGTRPRAPRAGAVSCRVLTPQPLPEGSRERVFATWLEFMDNNLIDAHRNLRVKMGGGAAADPSMGIISVVLKFIPFLRRLWIGHLEKKRKKDLPEICLEVYCSGGDEQAHHYVTILPELRDHMREKHPGLHFRNAVTYVCQQPNSLKESNKHVTVTITFPRGAVSTPTIFKTRKIIRNLNEEKFPARDHLQWRLRLGFGFLPASRWLEGREDVNRFERQKFSGNV